MISSKGWSVRVIVSTVLLAVGASSVPAAAGAPSSAGSGVVADWPTYQFGPAADGFNPSEHVLSPGNVSGLQHAWHYKTAGSFGLPAAVVAGGLVYIGSAGGPGHNYFYALNAKTGSVAWKSPTADLVNSTAAVANGIVYFTGGGLLYAFDARTGRKIWTFRTPDGATFEGSSVVLGGVLYAGTSACQKSCHLFALDARTGEQLWKYSVGLAGISTLAIDNGLVFFTGSSSGPGTTDDLFAVHATSGRLAWKWTPTIGSQAFCLYGPSTAHGLVYVESCDNAYEFALNERSGLPVWHFPLGYAAYASQAVATGVVYAMSGGGGGGGLFALDGRTGAKLWQFVRTHNCAFYQTSPAVANGVVYAEAHCGSLGGEYLALDAKTGKVLWTYTKAHNPGTPPTIVNGFAYFTSGLDGVVDAFTLPSGT